LRIGSIALAAVASALTAVPASAQSWNLYDGLVSAPTIGFAPMNYEVAGQLQNQPAIISLTMTNGSGTLTNGFVMDTGSTGIIATPDKFQPGANDKPVGTGFQYYSSSGRQENGTFYETTVVINDGQGNPVATSKVTVLQVTSVTCRFTDKGCVATNNPTGVAYMGVGFNRGVSSLQPPAPYTNTNPFTNVVSLANGASMANYRQGYRITNNGVTLGITSAETNGFGFVKLEPNGSGNPNDPWSGAPMTITVGGATGTGNILPDSGIGYAFLTPPSGATLQTQPCPGNVGTCIAPSNTTELAVYLPGQSSPVGRYTFNTGGTGNPTEPTFVQLVPDGPAVFLNTGRQFYAGFDYVFDAVGGYVGYRWTSPTGATGASTSTVALIGNVNLQDGFLSSMPTYLMGATTLLQQGSGQFSAEISGSGPLTIGSGTVTLTGVNTYTGGTVVNSGATLVVQADSGMGAAAGGLTLNGGTLQALANFTVARTTTLGANGGTFNTNGNNVTVANAIGGAGSLTKTGAGILTLTGAQTYQGGTVVNGGTLQLASGASLSSRGGLTVNSGIFDLNGATVTVSSLSGTGGTIALGNGRLVDNGTGTTTLSSIITGTGGLTKNGTGNLILTAVNTYSGATVVTGGKLTVNGSITSNVTVESTGTLGGSGLINGNITHTGTMAPGNSIGTLTINGSFTQSAGSTYQVEIDNTGQADRINVIGVPGTATLQSGTTVAVLPAAGGYGRSTRYTILTATGGVIGTYGNVSLANSAFLVPSLSYDANNVFLTVDVRFANGGQTPNQLAVGYALDQAYGSGSMSSDFANVLSAMTMLTPQQGAQALATLSGQSYTGFGTVAVQGAQSFMNAFSQQAGGGKGGGSIALAEACDVACDTTVGPRWGAWGGGVGAFGTVAGNYNAPGLTYNLGGFAAGLDYRFAQNAVAGVAVGYNAATLYPQGSSGVGNVGTLQFALYGEYTAGNAYLDAMAGYARSDNRLTRQIIIPGVNPRTAYGQTTSNQFFGQLEAGYKFVVAPSFGGYVTPFARLQASTSTQDGFTETGANSLNLSVASQTTNSLRTVLGAQLGAGLDMGWKDKLNVAFRLGWSHEFADMNRPVTAAFVGAPAFNFTTQGAVAPRDGVVLGLGLNTAITNMTSLFFRYDGELAGGNTNHTLSGGVRFVW
jgi:autotransporter-associated beta strand protein